VEDAVADAKGFSATGMQDGHEGRVDRPAAAPQLWLEGRRCPDHVHPAFMIVHLARPASGALASTPDTLLLIGFRRASTSCMIIPEYDIETIRFWVPDDCKRWESIMGSNAICISATIIFIAAIMAWV
jgi:hypothetical protein